MPKDMRQVPMTIGPFSDYGWMGGWALNEYVGRKASYPTEGVDPFRKPGVLQTGYRASQANSFITTSTNAMEVYSASGLTYLFANDIVGRVYQLDVDNHANCSVIASLSNMNSDMGFAVMQDYLFAAYNKDATGVSLTYLTRIGPLSQGRTANISFNVSMISSVQGVAIKHVIMPWKSNLYCMHANNIDYLDGNGISTGILTVGARLPSGMVVKTACPYGDRIAVGASDNLTPPSTSSNRGTRAIVYFYDGISNDWQKEIAFPENDILNLAYVYGDLLAWGFKWLYKYEPSTGGFRAIEPLDTSGFATHRHQSVNDGQVFFPDHDVIRSYGSPITYLERVSHKPYSGTGFGGVCKWVNNNRLYVSGNVSATNTIRYLSSSAETTVTWKSRFIELDGAKFRLAWIRVVTEPLATNDSLTVQVIGKADENTPYDIGTMVFSTDGAILSKEFFSKDFTTEPPYVTEMQIALKFVLGNVKVRRVDCIFETAPEY